MGPPHSRQFPADTKDIFLGETGPDSVFQVPEELVETESLKSRAIGKHQSKFLKFRSMSRGSGCSFHAEISFIRVDAVLVQELNVFTCALVT